MGIAEPPTKIKGEYIYLGSEVEEVISILDPLTRYCIQCIIVSGIMHTREGRARELGKAIMVLEELKGGVYRRSSTVESIQKLVVVIGGVRGLAIANILLGEYSRDVVLDTAAKILKQVVEELKEEVL